MSRKGFTLIEMSIVLIVIGVIFAGALRMISTSGNTSDFVSSKNIIVSMRDDIADYSATAKRLPKSDEIEIYTDSFGNDIDYIQNGLTESFEICSQKRSSITLRICDDSECGSPKIIKDIAFIVISPSEDGQFQYTTSSSDGIITIDYHRESDDIANWTTLNSLKKSVGCTEESSLKIFEKELPAAYYNNVYSYTITPSGGAEPYKWCVESADSGIRNDFRYGDKSIVSECSNDDFEESTFSINSNNTPLTKDYPQSNRITIHLKDDKAEEISERYTISYRNKDSMVYGETSTPSIVSGFADMKIANDATYAENAPEMASINPEKNELTITNTTRSASVCIWSVSTYRLNKMAVYFEMTPELRRGALYGFNFASIDANLNSADTCGDVGAGLNNDTISPNDLRGENYALEFDSREQGNKSDPPNDHLAVVSTWNNKSYSAHNNYNDRCNNSKGDGCLENDNLYVNGQKNSVRVEAYSGCNNDGTICDGTGGNICVYGWSRPSSSAELNLSDITRFYHNERHLTNPDVFDCYPVADKGLESFRYGFKSSGRSRRFEVKVSNFKMNNSPY